MNEDTKFNAAVRDAMESGIEIDAAAVVASLSPRPSVPRRWLVAASLALAVAFAALLSAVRPSGDDTVAETLAFMIAADGDADEIEVRSADELLMIWQDMPLAEFQAERRGKASGWDWTMF